MTQSILVGLTDQLPSTPPVFPVSSNVYGHCDGKFELDHPNWAEFTPAHPYVLFPL